jgi:hypothetical protein
MRATRAAPEQQQQMMQVLQRVYGRGSDDEGEGEGSEEDEQLGSEGEQEEVEEIAALLRRGLGGVLSEATIAQIAQQVRPGGCAGPVPARPPACA